MNEGSNTCSYRFCEPISRRISLTDNLPAAANHHLWEYTMKLPLLLCVCFSLISLPAWADKPYKQHPQSNENPYPEGKFQKKKDRPQASDEQRAEGSKIYRSKKLRIHKNGQGRYGPANSSSWQDDYE